MPPPDPHADTGFWRLPIADLLTQLRANPAGLSDAEAKARLAQYGPNLVHGARKRAVILQFLGKFLNPLVIILLIASAISGATGDRASFFVIFAIILMSVTLDFVQEHRAGQAADKLRDSVAVRGQVLREGRTLETPLEGIVPGDIANLAAGDMIPGDGRLLEAKDLFVNEALLTGEPYPVEKAPGELPEQTEALRAGNSVLMGTSVISGTGRLLVCRTGQLTALGEIADTLATKPPGTGSTGSSRSSAGKASGCSASPPGPWARITPTPSWATKVRWCSPGSRPSWIRRRRAPRRPWPTWPPAASR